METRFVRLVEASAGGMKIASRRAINPQLSVQEAFDEEALMARLIALFGRPDQVGDARFSYSIHDSLTAEQFEVYVASSGPAYGGTFDSFEDFATGKLKSTVLESLSAFEALIQADTAR